MIPIDAGEDYGREHVYRTAPYQPLPARISEDGLYQVYTRWQLSDEEREALAAGADLMLSQMTFGQALQPLRPWVAGLDEA